MYVKAREEAAKEAEIPEKSRQPKIWYALASMQICMWKRDEERRVYEPRMRKRERRMVSCWGRDKDQV